MVQFSHPYMTTGKTIALTRWIFVGKVMSLLFNMLSRFVTVFLPRSKCLLISWLQSPSAMILEPKKVKSHYFHCLSSFCREVMGPDVIILVFWILSFKPAFSLSSFTFNKRLFSSSLLSAMRVLSCAYLRILMFLPANMIPAVLYPAWHFSWCTLHITRVTIYSLDAPLSPFWTSFLFHVWFCYFFTRI